MVVTLRKRKILHFFVYLALLAVLAQIALCDGLTVKEYTVSSPLVTSPHTFAVVSDLHSTWYGEDQRELVGLVDQYAPEAVFMPGDFTQSGRTIEGSRALMEALSEKYPCFFTTGNHDRWSEHARDMRELYSSFGVCVLSDSSTELRLAGDSFRIHGVDDPLFYESEEAFKEAVMALSGEEGRVDILLSHRPEYAELYALCGFDLTVCGHAHGGQVRVPYLLNGLYAPHQGWFPPYAGGQYTVDGSQMIVSRGLMIDDLPRVFNPPELVVIHIVPTEN